MKNAFVHFPPFCFGGIVSFNQNNHCGSITLQLCPFNFQSTYFVVFVRILGKDAKEIQLPREVGAGNQIPAGIPFGSASLACGFFGLNLANITNDIVGDMISLWTSCTPTLLNGIWFGFYEGLPIPFGCNFLETDGTVESNPLTCGAGLFPVLCEIPFDPIVTTTTTTSTTTTSTSSSFTSETTVFTSTETLTSFFVTRITSTVVSGTSTFTTVTTTTTSCSTITRVHTSHCCPRGFTKRHDPHDHHHHHHHHSSSTSTMSLTTTTTTSTQTVTTTHTHHPSSRT